MHSDTTFEIVVLPAKTLHEAAAIHKIMIILLKFQIEPVSSCLCRTGSHDIINSGSKKNKRNI